MTLRKSQMNHLTTVFNYVDSVNDQDGFCRTLKYQYQKNSVENLLRTGSYGCSGAIEYVKPE